MVFNQTLKFKKSPPAWAWLGIFLLSVSGTFYLGLNPSFIAEWWWVLAVYNTLMGLLAILYIVLNVRRLRHKTQNSAIASKFTWSFIKIVPILVIVPVLSFYLFSFSTIQENVKSSEKTFDKFNTHFIQQVDQLYQGVQKMRNDRYTEQTKNLLNVVTSYGDFKLDTKTYKKNMRIFLDGLIDNDWACQISLFDSKGELISKSKRDENCNMQQQFPPQTQTVMVNEDKQNKIIRVKMSSYYINQSSLKNSLLIDVRYATDSGVVNFLQQVKIFSDNTKKIQFSANTSITQRRFLIDFSSTVLLTILSVLMIVFQMMERLMRPLNNLSLATKEITKGNYDVWVATHENDKDMRELIGHFNQMSRQIKRSREGLDTHNLYLETILKYSYGVIGLDREKRVQLINPVIAQILKIKDEQVFFGQLYENIAAQYVYLQPLFLMIKQKFAQNLNEWDEQIELSLPENNILLTCQGATLDSQNKILGYVIIIKDISKLHKAQKKAAWSEVAMRMAHEIKNPLTPILLSAQRLRDRFLQTLKGKDLAVIDKTTGIIIEQVKSMNTMVSAFANYTNTPQITRKSCDLNALIVQSVALYEERGDIDIQYNLSAEVPNLLLDSGSISRVLINLVKNASESVSNKRHLHIIISTEMIKNKVYLRIEDDGDGFDKAIIDKIFEPYITTKAKGSGLGLAIVQNIIEQHDGRIFVDNVLPHGAIINIEFDYANKS